MASSSPEWSPGSDDALLVAESPDGPGVRTDPPGRRSTDPAFGAVPRLNEWQIDSLFVTKMLAMALLLHGGLLGGVGGEAAGVDGSGEGAWTLATPAEGFLAASGARGRARVQGVTLGALR